MAGSQQDARRRKLDILRLNHEQLDVYQAAVEFLGLTAPVAEDLSRGYAGLGEQLRRAALSISLNIAEGYGKRGEADRCRFYDIARGSAHECGAIMDVAQKLKLMEPHTFASAKQLLHRIVSMLVKMVM